MWSSETAQCSTRERNTYNHDYDASQESTRPRKLPHFDGAIELGISCGRRARHGAYVVID